MRFACCSTEPHKITTCVQKSVEFQMGLGRGLALNPNKSGAMDMDVEIIFGIDLWGADY